jgi:phosphoribosylformimino-5-aminoimidazole carboxamide ribotide isomerase
MEIIPAIDIIDGKCVRLAKGDFDQKVIYNDDPVEVAKRFEAIGITHLHIVDLDGAKGKSLNNIKSLERIADKTSFVIDFGGGIKNTEQLQQVFNAGAAMVSVGSVTVKDPELFSEWVNNFGSDKFLPGADVLDKKIKINGWKEETRIDIFDFISSIIEKGIDRVFCTDISKDGMLQGPATGLYEEILDHFPSLNLIASGGISDYNDLLELEEIGCAGAIVGKAIYEEKISLKQIEDFIKNK